MQLCERRLILTNGGEERVEDRCARIVGGEGAGCLFAVEVRPAGAGPVGDVLDPFPGRGGEGGWVLVSVGGEVGGYGGDVGQTDLNYIEGVKNDLWSFAFSGKLKSSLRFLF